jgi:KaiC/GvpD/RAD55 family RecA-like ATPase
MSDTLTELSDRWAKLKERGASPALSVSTLQPTSGYYKPLADAADDYVRWAQSPHERVFTGIQAIDREMRGIAPGEMGLVIGFSHSGKTLVLLEILKANRNRNVCYFCPDEPRTLTLIKLACLLHSLDPIELERQVASDDQAAIQLLKDTANRDFPNLACYDESVTLTDMERAVGEVTDMWGRKPDLVVFDYLELLTGGGEDVPSKANSIKAWGRRHSVPLLVLHQTSRSSGADGKRLTISSGSYGGEQQATHIIGVRRKLFEIQAEIRELEEKVDRSSSAERLMERIDTLRYDERVHQHTLTLNLVKNKRTGGRLVDDVDFEIEQGTGRLTPLNGDLPSQYHKSTQMEAF